MLFNSQTFCPQLGTKFEQQLLIEEICYCNMPKEILIYSRIDEWSAPEFINSVEEAKDQDISVRVNSEGGSPEYGWGMIKKFSEHTGEKNVKVDGCAHSMAMFFLCYADNVEAISTAEFLIHRAAYPNWIENDPDYFDEAMRGNLERVNASLMTALKNKIDVSEFENLDCMKTPGYKLKDIFSMDKRVEVFITAKEAKKIKLIDKVVDITPAKRSELSTLKAAEAKKYGIVKKAATLETEKTTQKTDIMTLAELKEKHPAIFAEAVLAGELKERDRVGAFMAFIDVDAEAVKTGVKTGKVMSQTEMSELSLKAVNKAALKNIADDNAEEVETEEVSTKEVTAKEKNAEAFTKDVQKHLGKK